VQFLERRELPGHAFDEVSQPRGLGVVVRDRKDVDLDRHRGFDRQLLLAERAQDRLNRRRSPQAGR
jgi:hypothetical protein